MIRTLTCVNILYTRKVTCLYQVCRYAGHSKWQNIRHIKAEKDGQRSILFTRFGRLMRVAIDEGKNADPTSNLKLAHLIEQARKANMPVASINNVLKSAKTEAEKSESRIIELTGPGGSAFIVCIVTGNLQNVKAAFNSIFRKSKGAFSTGTIAHLFECKGIIETNIPPNTSVEDAINTALEINIEDVMEVGNESKNLQFVCESSIVYKIKTQLETKKYTVNTAEIIYEPLTPVVVQAPHLESINWLYGRLEEIPDVEEIFDNVAWPEDT